MKLVKMQRKSWWVPESNPLSLAVAITSEKDYYQAVKDKVVELILKEGDRERAIQLVTWAMEPQGVKISPTMDPVLLAEQILAAGTIGEMVREGGPLMAKPAPPEQAKEMIRAQAELTLLDFLT